MAMSNIIPQTLHFQPWNAENTLWKQRIQVFEKLEKLLKSIHPFAGTTDEKQC